MMEDSKRIELYGLKHIAFIMDGNGRWAKKRGLPRSLGHSKGIETFKEISKSNFEKIETERKIELQAEINRASEAEKIAAKQAEADLQKLIDAGIVTL